ncbi:MAG TPA: RIP metalloprotease RseP [Bacillota bacterium]
MLTVIASILVFGLLIMVHEFGHFISAKRAGVRVPELAFGFGPKIAGFKRGETEYNWRLFPIGGFCRMAGTNSEDPDDMGDPRGFGRRTVGQRMWVIAAGPAMNFLLAVVLFAFIFAAYGVAQPVPGSTGIGGIVPGYPAEAAGLKAGDRIVAIEGTPIADWEQMVAMIQKNPGRPLHLTVERQGTPVTLVVTPGTDPNNKDRGFLGISREVVVKKSSIPAAIKDGIVQTVAICVLWLKGLVMMILRKAPADVTGPLGITQMIGQAAQAGLVSILSFAAALSANLGLWNLLPIPALDGSRLVFLGLERLRGRPVSPEKENFIHFLGFAFLIFLIIVVTYRDILRLRLSS